MLAVENWETGSLEVAMLLDEAPSLHYIPGSTTGTPWRRNGPLATAALSSELHGHAWLVIVFHKDDPRTWGSKQVKIVAGGVMYTYERTRSGLITGKLRQLRFETLAADVFGYSSHLAAHTPGPGALQYRVIQSADMTLDPEVEIDGAEEYDELLGHPEILQQPRGTKRELSRTGKCVARDLGVRIVWRDEKQYGETWFLQDAQGVSQYRFELTEFSRRVFVKDIGERLGFIEKDDDTADVKKRRTQRQFRGHLRNLAECLQAMTKMLAPDETVKNGASRRSAENGRNGVLNGNGTPDVEMSDADNMRDVGMDVQGHAVQTDDVDAGNEAIEVVEDTDDEVKIVEPVSSNTTFVHGGS